MLVVDNAAAVNELKTMFVASFAAAEAKTGDDRRDRCARGVFDDDVGARVTESGTRARVKC